MFKWRLLLQFSQKGEALLGAQGYKWRVCVRGQERREAQRVHADSSPREGSGLCGLKPVLGGALGGGD